MLPAAVRLKVCTKITMRQAKATEIHVGKTLGAIAARTECVIGPRWQVLAL